MNGLTYKQAAASASSTVWPGCKGQGACMPCGRLHDFGTANYKGEHQPDVRCWQNYLRGCPSPKPQAEHSPNRLQRCRRCRTDLRAVRQAEDRRDAGA